MTEIRPFQIAIPDAAIDDLRRRLAATRWPEKEVVSDWSQGVPLGYVQEVCDYWATKFDWRKWEAKLNGWPQYTTQITVPVGPKDNQQPEALDIHFFHVKSKHENARPLLISHGWPGSQIEFHKIIDPLVNPTAHGGKAEDAFHVVAPSLPGYGFSGKPTRKGWGIPQIAMAYIQLMARLGYTRYFAQGGDWGSAVARALGGFDPNCAGIHINMVTVPVGSKEQAEVEFGPLTPLEARALQAAGLYMSDGNSYALQQKTRPQTLGYALADSPAGQCAWILEKFHAWTDCDGRPENVLSRDEMLADISIYWFTNSAASSGRLYLESFGGANRRSPPLPKPVGCTIYPKEIFQASERWAKVLFPNIVHWSEQPKGGHFAAFEQPEAFVADLRDCFGKMTL
jgi:epoxide hydrolase